MSKRINYIDTLRAFAVILMVVAHVFSLWYAGDNQVIRGIQWLGDTVAFQTFLFVSGISTYLSLKASQKSKNNSKKKLGGRVLKLMGGFYLVSMISSIEDILLLNPQDIFDHIFQLLTLQKMGDYSEFIIPFVLFSIFVTYFSKQLLKILESKWKIVALSVGSYFLGFILFSLDFGSIINTVKSMFAGHSGLYRFPVLQYFPIFFGGMYYGKIIKEDRKDRLEQNSSLIGSGILILLFLLIPITATLPFGETYNRWPPNISFLTIGVFSTLLMLNISQFFDKRSIYWQWLVNMGKNAFNIYIVHVIILEVLDLFYKVEISNIFILIFFTIIFLIFITQGVNLYKIGDNRRFRRITPPLFEERGSGGE